MNGQAQRAAAREAGSGTVLTLALVAAVLILFAATALLARAQASRGSAQTAADLGALAAAGWLAQVDRSEVIGSLGGGPACEVARDVVTANRASMDSCVLVGDGVVRVVASRSTGLGIARASAFAGPRDGG